MAKAITRRTDLLGFGRGRRKNCVEAVRKAARKELEDVWAVLQGHRCLRCGDALLRLAEQVAFNEGAEAGLDVVEKADVAPLAVDLECRSLALRAYLLRHRDSARGLSLWAAALATEAPVREHADAWRRGAFVLADAGSFGAARSALLNARRLHVLADRVSPIIETERYLGAVDVGVVYVEVSAYYLGCPADLRVAIGAGVRVLRTVDYGDAPRTWLAGLTNFLGAIVCAWRAGLTLDLEPPEILRLVEAGQRAVPRSSLADICLRWLRALALSHMHGLTPRTLGMFERAHRALIAEGRSRDATRVLLDIVWFDAYGLGSGVPDQAVWVHRATRIIQLAQHGRTDTALLIEWLEACRNGVVEGDLMERLMYEVRGVRVSARTVRLSSKTLAIRP